jgi:hypothetical protein
LKVLHSLTELICEAATLRTPHRVASVVSLVSRHLTVASTFLVFREAVLRQTLAMQRLRRERDIDLETSVVTQIHCQPS